MATQPIYAMTDSWTSAGTTFTGIGMNITDAASAADSMLIDMQVGGASRFKVGKAGGITGSSLTVSGLLSSASGLAISAGGASIVGNLAVTGNGAVTGSLGVGGQANVGSLLLGGSGSVIGATSPGTQSNAGVEARQLAGYRNSGSATTGAIVFKAPSNLTAVMMQFLIQGHLFTPAQSIDMTVTGYRTSGAFNASAMSKLSIGTVDVPVRLATDANGNACLILGDVNTVWSYPHIRLSALFSHGTYANVEGYSVGWTTELVTSLTGYTNLTAPIANTLPALVSDALALKADLASPAFTGNPTVPNQAAGNNTTRAANTAFVTTAVANALTAIRDGVASGFDTLKKLSDRIEAHIANTSNPHGLTAEQAGAYALVPTSLTTENLNDIVAPGNYHQPLNNNATLARNYPVAQAGYLEVKANALSSGYCYQTYTHFNGQGVWHREKYSPNAWGAWRKVATTDDVAAGDAAQVSRTGDTGMTGNFTTSGTFRGNLAHSGGYFNIDSFSTSVHGNGYARLWYSATLRNLTFTGMGDGTGPVSLLGCSMAASQITGLGSLATKSTVQTADLGDGQVTAPKMAANSVSFNALTTIASQTLVGRTASGTGDATALTAAQAAALLGISSTLQGNGILRLPGGFILQWGVSSSPAAAEYSHTFPVAFPNECLGGLASVSRGSGYPTTYLYGVSCDTFSATSMAFRKRRAVNGGVVEATSDGFEIRWIAIGR